MTTQYGVLLNEQFKGVSLVHMDDTMQLTYEEALSEAESLLEIQNRDFDIVGIFKVDTETGEVETVMTTAEIDDYFSDESIADRAESANDWNKHIDSFVQPACI